MRPADKYLRPPRGVVNLVDVHLNFIVGVVLFARNLVAAGHYRLNVAQVNVNKPVILPFNLPRYDFMLVLDVFVVNLLPFSFPHALEDHLLGGLCGNPAEVAWGDLKLNRVAQFVCLVNV